MDQESEARWKDLIAEAKADRPTQLIIQALRLQTEVLEAKLQVVVEGLDNVSATITINAPD